MEWLGLFSYIECMVIKIDFGIKVMIVLYCKLEMEFLVVVWQIFINCGGIGNQVLQVWEYMCGVCSGFEGVENW